MPRRQWDATTTALIVLEGLTGQSGAEICPAHQLRPSLYDPWRDQFLAHAATAVEAPQRTRKEARLDQANARLKPLVGERTCARNTSDEGLA
jgi:transposase-like protein